jgi:hypothetical protein
VAFCIVVQISAHDYRVDPKAARLELAEYDCKLPSIKESMIETHLTFQGVSSYSGKFLPRRNCQLPAFLIALSTIAFFCTPLQAHFRSLDPWVGNQRPSPAPTPVRSPAPPPAPTPAQPDPPDPTPAPVVTPSPEEVARQQRHAASLALNNQGCDAYAKHNWAAAAKDFEQALQSEPNDQTVHNNLANAFTCQAVEAQDNGDYETAIIFLQQAIAQNPDNAKSLQSRLAGVKERLQNREQDKVISTNMQRGLDALIQSLTAIPSPSTLQPVEPPVVDARNVPTDLPKSVEDAINAAYRNAPAGVSDRVRKGFQAVMDQDWKAAKAWFQDALNRDLDNAGLKSLVTATDSTLDRAKQAATLTYVELGQLMPPPPAAPTIEDPQVLLFIKVLSESRPGHSSP